MALNLRGLLVYLVRPPAGALVATLLVVTGMRLQPVTAKLFHDPAYGSIFMHETTPKGPELVASGVQAGV